MNIVEFVRDLQKSGVKLYMEEGQLRCLAPKGALSREDQSYLKQYKKEIIAQSG